MQLHLPGIATVMQIIIFKYGSLLATETFIKTHINLVTGGYENLLHLDNWSTPKLGHRALWKDDAASRIVRKFLLKTLYHNHSEELHRASFGSALRKCKPVAVLAEFGYSGAHIVEPCRQLGIPLVVHFHGTDVNRREVVEKHAAGYQAIFQYASKLIAVSEHMKDRLSQLGADPVKIAVIPCGATFPAECQLNGRPTGEFNILSVARFAPVKAPQLVILAFHQYLSKGGQGHLHMVGEGPLLPFCECMTQGLRISDRVTFHGGLPHEKTLEILGGSHLYIQHSVVAPDGDCEGMPVSIMEAAGYGLPIVATRHGGIPDFIEHEKNGCLVDEYDVDGMAHYMYEIFRNPGRALNMGQRAAVKARQGFDVRMQCEMLKRVVLNASGDRRVGG